MDFVLLLADGPEGARRRWHRCQLHNIGRFGRRQSTVCPIFRKREAVLNRLALSLVIWCVAAMPAAAENFIVYVGSYTDAPSTSKGIYAARFDTGDASLTPVGLAAETVNPAYLSGDDRFLFTGNWQTPAVAAGGLDTVSAFRIDRKTGKLSLLNVVTSGGALPNEVMVDPSGKVLVAVESGKMAYLENIPSEGKSPRNMAFDPTGRYLFVANQGSGNVVVFKADASAGHLSPTGSRMDVSQAGGIVFERVQ